MLANFFQLDGDVEELDALGMRARLDAGTPVSNALYRPDDWPADIRGVREVTFRNVSFSKTRIEKETFTRCTFVDCLFIGSTFADVEFHGCTFENCNFYKSEFSSCYIDPSSFRFDKSYRKTHANIGVSLYQSLLEVAAAEKQSDFERKADMAFRRWKRDQLPYDFRSSKIRKFDLMYLYASNYAYEMLAGYGYRPERFIIATIFLFTLLSILNMFFLSGGLQIDGVAQPSVTFFDSLFYTYSMMTALGFSSITPVTSAAKVYAVVLALAGIGWLGVFTSLLVKRFLK